MPANPERPDNHADDKAVARLRKEIQRDRVRLTQLLEQTPAEQEESSHVGRLYHVFSLMKDS